MLFLFACLAVSLAQVCPPFTVQDPTSGTSYTYNYAGYAVPNTPTAPFIQAKEDPSSNAIIYVNICGDSSQVGCGSPTPACQNDGATNYFSLGKLSTWTAGPYYDPAAGQGGAKQYGAGIVVHVGNGDSCSNGVLRNAFFFLHCDPNQQGRISTMSVTEVDPNSGTKSPCTYWFDVIPSALFCPGGGGGGGVPGAPPPFDYGWVFVIIVLCGLFLYFVIGIIILKFALHKEGREIVPQVDFWTALPLLVWDGMKYAFCCVPCRGGGSYTEV